MKSILKNTLLVFVLLFISSTLFNLYAQTHKTDSLENLLQQHKPKDTIRVNLLNETAFHFLYDNLEKTLKYTEEASEIADKLNFAKGKAESLRIMGVYSWNKSNYPEALGYYEKSLKIFEEIGNKKGISDCYFNMGTYYKYHNNYLKALSFFEKSLEINKEQGNKKEIAINCGWIGAVYSDLGNYPKSIEYRLKALHINTDLHDKKETISSLINIGATYSYLDDYSKAIEYYKKGLEIPEKIDYPFKTALLYHNIGFELRVQKDYSQSMEYSWKALEMYEKLNNKESIANCNIDIGICYRMQNDFDNALKHFDKSLNIDVGLGQEFVNSRAFNELSRMYFEQNKIREAYNYGKKAYLSAEKIDAPKLLKESSEILAKSCNNLGRYKEAYEYNVIYYTISDRLFNEKNIKKIAALEYEYKYKQEIELLEEKEHVIKVKLESEKKVKYFLSAILILLIVFIMFIIKNRKRKIAHARLIEKNLSLKIENREKELTTNVLYLLKKNEFLANLTDTLQELNNRILPENKTYLRRIIRDIERNTFTDSWEEFEKRFQDVHVDFYKKLNAEFSNLTPNELKLCAFLKLNMTSKDISAITNQSVDSLKVARYRLRKKLGLSREDNLISFLVKL